MKRYSCNTHFGESEVRKFITDVADRFVISKYKEVDKFYVEDFRDDVKFQIYDLADPILNLAQLDELDDGGKEYETAVNLIYDVCDEVIHDAIEYGMFPESAVLYEE